MVRTCNGNGAEGVTENARNVTENVRNVPKNVRKITKNVRISNEKASEGRETLEIVGGRSNGKCSKCSEKVPKKFGKNPRIASDRCQIGKRILLSGSDRV